MLSKVLPLMSFKEYVIPDWISKLSCFTVNMLILPAKNGAIPVGIYKLPKEANTPEILLLYLPFSSIIMKELKVRLKARTRSVMIVGMMNSSHVYVFQSFLIR